MKKFPAKELVDALSAAHTILDRRKKTELIQFIEGILIETKQAGLGDSMLVLFRSAVDGDVRDSALRIVTKLLDESLVTSIITMLRSPKRPIRLAALKLMEMLPVEEVVTKLAAELTKGDWADWNEPLNFLFKLSPENITGPCRRALEVGNEEDKIQAIKYLTIIKTPEAVRAMEYVLEDESIQIRMQVAKSLAKIGGPIAVRSLIKLTSDGKPDVVLSALDGLRELKSPAGIQAVLSCLKHENVAIRNNALNALGDIGTADEVGFLVNALKDQDLRIRQGALDSLINLSQSAETDIPKFISILMSDPDVNVRRAAAQILGQIDAPGIFERMFDYLKDEDWWVRETIAETLSKIKDDRIFPAAVELMSNPDPSLRRYAIEILVGLKDPRSLVPLIKMLKDPDWWVRERAVSALGVMGSGKIVPILANLLSIKELAYVTAEALGQIADKSAIPFLLKALQDGDVETRIMIFNSLEKLDAREAIPEIEKYVSDPVRDVRIRVKEILSRLKVDTKKLDQISDRWWEHHAFSLLDTLLLEVRFQKGTDLFMISNDPPIARIRGEMMPLSTEVLTEEQILAMVAQILTPEQEQNFIRTNDLDFSYEIADEGRFRGTMFRHSQGINLSFRLLPDHIPVLEALGLPPFVKTIPKIHHGLVLVSGPTTCGKSTTLAAIINEINEHQTSHIITIEDPIEYVHIRKQSLVTQREVGRHTMSFSKALRAALREDPDVILIGELRDLESISMALMAAETGHLVFATLHAMSAVKTIDRVVDAFAVAQQMQVRSMISESLKAILSQQLIPRKDGLGNVVAMETLVNTPAISGLIRENKLNQIPSMITSGQQYGMISMDQSLTNLLKEGLITGEEAYSRAEDKNQFEAFLREEGSRS